MDKLSIVKIGGNIIEDNEQLGKFLTAFTKIEGGKVLVHGGGKKATILAKKLGVPTKIIDGRRITDEDNLEITTMIYGGKINKNMVAQLQAIGCNAIGLSGADGNAIQAVKRPVKEVDFGYVGDITGINTSFFKLLLQAQYVPVCCAITHDQKGQLLNTNADTIAASLAKSLSKFFNVALYYCLEIPGVLKNINDKESLIGVITPNIYNELKSNNLIHSGMIPKIDNCFEALYNGVSQVKIGSAQMISGNTKYTKLILDDE